MALSLLYTISPIDLVPDAIPVAGWVEDGVFMLGAILNLVQHYNSDSKKGLISILKILKWIAIAIGVLIILIFGVMSLLVYNIFA